MEPAIETVGLTRTFGTLVAVNNLNLRVEANTVHGFLGPNGAGKSTTIKMLLGLLKPSRGVARVLGKEVKGDDPRSRLRVGFMPELPKFPKHLKGSELLDIYGRLCGMDERERKEQVPKLIEMVGLKGREGDLIGSYSKGMQQRIGIAQALLGNPELVILDEPSIGLDPVGMVEVRELMKGIAKQGGTVFLSSHLLFEVEQVCTHVTIVHHGSLLVSDSLQKVSSMIHGQPSLRVEVSKLTDEVVRGVKGLASVSKLGTEGNTMIIELGTDEDVRAQISQEITRRGGIIVSMNVVEHKLEDVFVQLVSGSEGGEAPKP